MHSSAPSPSQPSIKPIWQISFFNGFVKMFTTAVVFFWAIYYNSIGFSGVQIGIIWGLFSLTGLITVLPSGFINDKIKSKHLITIGLILLAAQFIGISIFHSFEAILFFTILGGIGNNLEQTSVDSLFYKSTEKSNVAKKIAIYQSVNYLFIGSGVIASGSLLNSTMPFGKLIFTIGLGFILLALISIGLPKSVTTNFEFLKYKSDILKPKVLFFLLIMFLFSFHFGAENTSYGLFLNKTLGLSQNWVGIYMGTAIFSMGLSATIFAKSLKKIKVRSLLLTGLLLSSLGHMLMTVNDPVLSFIFRLVHETGDAAMYVFLAYGITSLFDLERMGGNNGIVTFITIIGSTTSGLIFGPLGAASGYNIPLLITGIVIGGAFIIALLFNQFILQKEHRIT